MEHVEGETPEQAKKRHLQQATSWKTLCTYFVFLWGSTESTECLGVETKK